MFDKVVSEKVDHCPCRDGRARSFPMRTGRSVRGRLSLRALCWTLHWPTWRPGLARASRAPVLREERQGAYAVSGGLGPSFISMRANTLAKYLAVALSW